MRRLPMSSTSDINRNADQAFSSRNGCNLLLTPERGIDSAAVPRMPRLRNKFRAPFALRGAVLLEVVLALALFAAAATIIGAGIHSAIDAVERQKLNAHALDLAVSVISEI